MSDAPSNEPGDARSNHFAPQALTAFVHRIERLEEDIAGLNDDKGEVYAEAKGLGFDKVTLRRLLKRRKQGKADVEEQDYLLDVYERAVQQCEASPPKE